MGLGGFTPPKSSGDRGPRKRLRLLWGGQNARLAAKLTGYKIDIKPESDPGELPTAEDTEVEIVEEPEESVDIEE